MGLFLEEEGLDDSSLRVIELERHFPLALMKRKRCCDTNSVHFLVLLVLGCQDYQTKAPSQVNCFFIRDQDYSRYISNPNNAQGRPYVSETTIAYILTGILSILDSIFGQAFVYSHSINQTKCRTTRSSSVHCHRKGSHHCTLH